MFQRNKIFGPETIPLLTTAFEKAWVSYLHNQDRRLEDRNKMRDELAACVIDASTAGELDSSRLARKAVAQMRRRELSHTS